MRGIGPFVKKRKENALKTFPPRKLSCLVSKNIALLLEFRKHRSTQLGLKVYCSMQRLRTSGSSIIGYLSVPQLRRKVLNSLSAVQDTYYSTKDIFENHKVVFTIGTSLASIATAWGGYTLRHLHDSRVDQRLDSIEKAMKNNYHLENSDFKKLVGSGSSSAAAYVATAGTSLIIGYGFGWRGGKWYANRKFRKEQMKLLGQIKPKRWQLKFLRRPLTRPRLGGSAVTVSEGLQKDVPGAHNS